MDDKKEFSWDLGLLIIIVRDEDPEINISFFGIKEPPSFNICTQ